MADEMATIWTSLQKPGGDLESTFHEVDGRQETKMFDEALQTNVSAVCDAARSVRMGLATGAPAVEQGDLSKVIRHAAEVADLLMRTSNTKAVTAHKAQLKNMIAELHSLEAESASNAVISGQLKSSELYRNAMATIEAKAGR
jgi:predicted sugar kinase